MPFSPEALEGLFVVGWLMTSGAAVAVAGGTLRFMFRVEKRLTKIEAKLGIND